MLCKRGLFYWVSRLFVLVGVLFLAAPSSLRSQSNSGIIQGNVTDPSKAAVPGAKVHLENPVSHHVNDVTTDTNGHFEISNIPFNPYHLTVTASGFANFAQDVDVRSTVPINMDIMLALGAATTNITVTAENAVELIEQDSTFHTDVDRALFDKLPLESQSSSLSSLITLSSPGVFADSNGLFHGLGDHAQNSFSIDGQPITDQQSKVFSNQIPTDAVQSLEVISGAPPAEFGGKTSLVVVATTRSGLGLTQPTGSFTTSYGSFGTVNAGFDVAFGSRKWGNFLAVNGLNTSRFLDPPEFTAFHAKGNEENVFDRFDFKLSNADTIQLNFNFTRSWFQQPNSYDALHFGAVDPFGDPLPATDQRAQIRTFNFAPSWTHEIGSNAVLNIGGFLRRDQFQYFPSNNPFADFIPNEQLETITQDRHLTNAGVRGDISYSKGIHTLKIGAVYQHTLLTEDFALGLIDPSLNPACFNADGSFDPAANDPGACAAGETANPAFDPTMAFDPAANPACFLADGTADPNIMDPAACLPGQTANPNFSTSLACHDLTRPVAAASSGCPVLRGTAISLASPFIYHAHKDIRELGVYVQDTINKGNWSFNVGFRLDDYRGFVNHTEPEPRLGIAYNIKPTNTVLRVSYARTLETPFNENLIIASTGCGDPFVSDFSAIAFGTPCVNSPIGPGWRNEFHAGVQQAFGKYFVLDAEYMWKYTHGAYDFSDFGNTPIFFPITWNNSKIPGFSVRASVPNFHRFSAFVVLSSVAARFFNPQVAGLGSGLASTGVFRIDHDEKFEETTHIQYQPFARGPWVGFNWRYDSGLVAGAVPFAVDSTTPVDASGLTPNEQAQAGLFCGSVHATPLTPISADSTCAPSLYGSTLLKIPAPGTEDDDHNPPRVAPRHLFDLSVGDDDLFHFKAERYKVSLRLTMINLTNKVALYNFLSTFSGTHYVTPRSETVELGFHF
jgi:Carboxypeptidase regulatory-like domain